MNFAIKIVFCIAVAGGLIHSYIEKQNELIILRLAIPAQARELNAIQEENIRLQYTIDQFETPEHLMKLAQEPEFAHLKHPYAKDILLLQADSQLPCPSFEGLSETGLLCDQ